MVFKTVFLDSFTGMNKSPCAIVSAIETCCQLVREVDLADQRNKTALDVAQQVLRR